MARTIILSMVCLLVGVINAKQIIGIANAEQVTDEVNESHMEQNIQPQREMRDPTAPLRGVSGIQQTTSSAGYRPALQSIICDDSRCHAIIDGKVVKSGQSINGYKVHSINPKKVVLTRGGTVWNLELFSQIIKN